MPRRREGKVWIEEVGFASVRGLNLWEPDHSWEGKSEKKENLFKERGAFFSGGGAGGWCRGGGGFWWRTSILGSM